MRNFLFTMGATTGLTGSYSTSGAPIPYTTMYAVQALFTGNMNGLLSLSSSNDNVNFDVVTGSTTAIVQNLTGSTGHFTWNAPFPGYQYVRGNFQNSSATTGSLQFCLFSKGF